MECKICDAKKKRLGGKPQVCKHTLDRLPPWKDAEKHEMVKLIFEQVGRSGDYDRESRGIVTDDGDFAFQSEWIDKLEQRKPFLKDVRPKWILVTCDPNGGGESSDMAIFSSYLHNGKMVVCGIDSHPTKTFQKKQLLLAHIKALRRIERFRHSWIIFVPENNLDDGAARLAEAAEGLNRVHLYLDDKMMVGAKTKAFTKIQYTQRATDYLAMDNIVFDPDLVCANPFVPESERWHTTKSDFFRQLRQWRILTYQGKTAKAAPYLTCSGKTDDNGNLVPGQKDDKCMTFVMNSYFLSDVVRNRDKFPADIYQ